MYIFTYILKCSDNTYYTGITKDMHRRLSEHLSGRCSYTSTRLPCSVIFKHPFISYKSARWFEKKIKKYGAKKFIAVENFKKEFETLCNLI